MNMENKEAFGDRTKTVLLSKAYFIKLCEQLGAENVTQYTLCYIFTKNIRK